LTSLFWQYSYLQVLDFLTTVAFLVLGVQEGNPVVRWAISAAPNPILGLLFIKAAAMLLGFYCFQMERVRLLRRMNLLFAIVVAWNLLALIIGGLQIAHVGSI